MLQKYKVEIDEGKNLLTIKEFAFIGKERRASDRPRPRSDDFLEAYEVKYQLDVVSKAIATGKEALMEELRTDVFYPAEMCVDRIADHVIEMFSNENRQPIELFFDDREMLADVELNP